MTEQRQQELLKQAEYGLKCKTAREVFDDFLLNQRAQIIRNLESEEYSSYERLNTLKTTLRILRQFDNAIERYIQEGEIAQKELNKDGNE